MQLKNVYKIATILSWPQCVVKYLAHLPLDKMAAILEDDNFKCIFLNENDRFLLRI